MTEDLPLTLARDEEALTALLIGYLVARRAMHLTSTFVSLGLAADFVLARARLLKALQEMDPNVTGDPDDC